MSIELDHVTFRYPDGTEAISRLSLSIEAGSRVAIIGQNGAGKTTAAKLMNGLLKPSEGTVRVDGLDTRKCTTAESARKVAYVFQNPDDQLFKSRVYDEIAFLGRYLGTPAAELHAQVLGSASLAGVETYLESNPKDVPLAVRKFVALAALLMGRADYFILDEPTGGIDLPGTEVLRNIMDAMTARGAAIVTISHDMRFVIENFDRVVAMANGKVVADGSPEAVFSRDEVLRECALYRPEATEFAMKARLSGRPQRMNDICASVSARLNARLSGAEPIVEEEDR